MRGSKKSEFAPDYAQPPGAYLEEILDQRGIRKTDFAIRCGRPAKTISEIIAGKAAILPDTAIQFERVLGDIKANVWLAWEANYQLHAARERERQGLQRGKEWAQKFPLHEMHTKGYITQTKDIADLVARLLNFFGVSSVAAWEEYWSGRVTAARFKRARAVATNNYAVAAWLRRGDVEASEIDCMPYDEARFRDALIAIRSLTRSCWPDFRDQLVEDLSSAGVSIAFVPDLSGLKLRGAAYWATKDRAVIIVSDHMRLQSRFWFALFHEAMHILLHSKKALFIDYDVKSDEELAEEKEADNGAANTLVAAEHIREFIIRYGKYAANYKSSTIASFAREIGIGPDLLLARLQKEEIIPWNSRFNKEFCDKVDFSNN